MDLGGAVAASGYLSWLVGMGSSLGTSVKGAGISQDFFVIRSMEMPEA